MGTMLVTLVRPPAVTTLFFMNTSVVPPIGVAYLAGSLRANGIDVAVVDAIGEAMDQESSLSYSGELCIGLTVEQVVARVSKDTDIIGVSCMFSSSWPHDKGVIEALRAEFPHAFLVSMPLRVRTTF
ncbi:MAG TPA: hypothetical protein EYN66_03195 [Myxococcales bacterium]|nr:hypothetical protein [Myxococcales bacterium]